MYTIKYGKSFRREYKKIRRSDPRAVHKLSRVLSLLLAGNPLDARYRPHRLRGEFRECTECHLCPDVLLIYHADEKEKIVYLLRVGSHSELFG